MNTTKKSRSMKLPDEKDMLVSYYTGEKPLLPHNLKERENSLIGNYFEVYRKVPKYQFGNYRQACSSLPSVNVSAFLHPSGTAYHGNTCKCKERPVYGRTCLTAAIRK